MFVYYHYSVIIIKGNNPRGISLQLSENTGNDEAELLSNSKAHCIALVASDATKAEPWFQVFETSLIAVCAYFSHSDVRSSETKEKQKILIEHRQLKLQKVTETRWLSHALT